MTRGKRIRLEEGIFRDDCGIAAKLQVGDYTREKRFEPGTPIAEVRKWKTRTRAELEALPATARATRGTLERDVEVHVRHLSHLKSWRERRAELRAWTKLYGTWRRRKIKADQVKDARRKWLAAGVAPKTINNRVHSLAQLYHDLDGRRAPTPCDEIKPLEVPRTVPVHVAPEIVRAVYRKLLEHERCGYLRNAKTRARFMVIASSGARPSELMRAEPDDIDWDSGIWHTRDGKGGRRPYGLPLTEDLAAAWRVFIEAGAWGDYETTSHARTLRYAGWPAGARPYKLRSSIAIALLREGADLADVSAWLGHSRLDTTRRSYTGVLPERMQVLADSVGSRIDWATAGHPEPGTNEAVSK